MVIAYLAWLARLTWWWLRGLVGRWRRPPAYLAFLIESPPPEPPPAPAPRWQRLLGRPTPSLAELRRRARRLCADDRVAGMLLHLRPLPLSAAQVASLRDLIAEVRATGRRVVCWAPTYLDSTYQVACAADEILLQPGGSVAPLGVAQNYVFLAESLERVGLQADLLQISPYKTAGDALTRRGFTPEAREMADWLADAAFSELLEAVAAGRGCDRDAARRVVDESPYTDRQALSAGVVDAVISEEEVPGRLGGELRSWESAGRRVRGLRPPRPGHVVGLLRVEGVIVDGRSRRAPLRPPLRPPLLLEDQCGDLTIVEQARALAANRRVRAVVVWVNSRGGSATASESMAAALARLAREKPLVVAMGSVAASGGYYVSTPARCVFAHPGTVTGSIGVLGGKLVATSLFDRLLLHRELVQRGRHAAMDRPDRPYTEAERQKLWEMIERSYEVFVQRVAEARGRTVEEILPIAGGRVWTGRQAMERGLVDRLGGLEEAIAAARELAGLPGDAPVIEARGGRRDPVGPPSTTAAIEHALELVATLDRSVVWWLCPLVREEP
ncbi:MAG TPA: signal peptide peptidase SppA [Candidatus Dormibacteraeota bacterium]|nr:signal peptide peptidase SppA [Candidatus Dormibacteraeota bacterium]